MNLFDKLVRAYQNNEPMPLKGHTRLTLTDVKTGKTKTTESDNMVTNAVANILARNYSALTDYSRLLPLKNLFGGVLLFSDNITEDADNYNPPSELVNAMTACAGQTAHSTANPYRGNPNGGETVTTDTSIKFVWDWSTNQGIGPINCVSLCPSNLGDNGLKPFGTMSNCWTPLAVNNTATSGSGSTSPSSRADFLRYPISISSDGQTGKVIYWTGTDFEEITIRKDFYKFGIMRGSNDFQEVSSRSTTTRTFNKGQIFEDDDYYYCYAITGAHAVQIDRISKDDLTVTQMDLSGLGGAALYTGSFSWTNLNRSIPAFAYDGHYLYLPNSSANGFVGVNPNNAADILDIDGTVSLYLSSYSSGSGSSCGRPVVISSGLVYGDNYLINGNKLYPKSLITIPYSTDSTPRINYQNVIRDGASVWDYPAVYQGYNVRGQGAVLLEMFLSTINNLDSEVQKSSSQTMKVEYTLTEV